MNNPVLTGIVGDNSDLFQEATRLYLKKGGFVLDMTWGHGVFWARMDLDDYSFTANDLDPALGRYHYDFRELPKEWADTYDAVVLDPPYASRSSNKNSIVGGMYNNGKHDLRTVEDMLQFYHDGMVEAYRVLKTGGILFVKCQDEVAGGKQRRNHISIWNDAMSIGFMDEDLFTLVQKGKPIMRHDHQIHARKNNSFLWVMRKK